MALLRDRHAGIRWRAAEVAAACVQNNPPVQEWLLKSGCLPKLLKLLEDPDITCRSVPVSVPILQARKCVQGMPDVGVQQYCIYWLKACLAILISTGACLLSTHESKLHTYWSSNSQVCAVKPRIATSIIHPKFDC